MHGLFLNKFVLKKVKESTNYKYSSCFDSILHLFWNASSVGDRLWGICICWKDYQQPNQPLCCFHTSLPLDTLPLCSANATCSFTVNTERCCRNGSSQSGNAPKLNWSQLYAICRCGQSGKVIDLLARQCLPLGHPWATSGVCAIVKILPSKRQSGEWQACLKAALGFQLKGKYNFFSWPPAYAGFHPTGVLQGAEWWN